MNAHRAVGLILVVVLCGAAAETLATEPADAISSWALRAEASFVDFSFAAIQTRIDGALGFKEIAGSAWLEASPLNLTPSAFGAALSLQRDWLSLHADFDQRQDVSTFAVYGRAAPPAWILVNGTPTVLAELGLTVSSTVAGPDPRQDIVLNPQLTGVLSTSGILVKPALNLDITLGSDAIAPMITQVHLSSTVDLGTVILTSTVSFERAFDAFKSLSLALSLPECGWMMTGSWLPLGNDTSVIRIAVRAQWGNVSLLPSQTGDTGQICTGDVCF